MIGGGTVGKVPEQIAEARGRRTDVRVRVVAVDAPCLQGALHDEVVTWAAYMVHDFFAAIFLEGFADARAESFQHFVPRGARPFATAARTVTLHGIEDAIGIVNLGDRRRAFRTQASATGGMFRVAFELIDPAGFFVDVRQQ